MTKFNKNWMKQLSESYIWEMSDIPPMFPPGGDPSPQPMPQPRPAPEPFIPPMEPTPRPRPRMGQANNGRRGDQRKPGRGGRTTNSERGPTNVNWANLWRQYTGSGYNNATLEGLYLQAQRAGYNGSFGEFYATLFAEYGEYE